MESQKQHTRWIASFNCWRGAKHTWNDETQDEVDLRKDTRLLILASQTPLLKRQRHLDGRTMVISSGLIVLLDELLLAEAVSDPLLPSSSSAPGAQARRPDCFDAFATHVLEVAGRNRDATPHEPLTAWPRLTTSVEAGSAAKFGANADDGPCKTVTAARLRSPVTQARIAESADALALWLLTYQNLQLARLPALDPAKATKPCQPIIACLPAASSPVAPAASASAAASYVESPLDERSRLAVRSTGRREPRTARWLLEHMPVFDAGSSPSLTP